MNLTDEEKAELADFARRLENDEVDDNEIKELEISLSKEGTKGKRMMLSKAARSRHSIIKERQKAAKMRKRRKADRECKKRSRKSGNK